MTEKRVGLIGARSFVGDRVSHLLVERGYHVLSFSRKEGEGIVSLAAPVANNAEKIKDWIYLAPIWTLQEHFQLLQQYGVNRLIALSSTSRFTKIASSSSSERQVADQLKEGEESVLQWSKTKGVETVILQPTLIYGWGKDKNVTQIANLISRFGIFPLLGKANGLRQPVHVDDVASACVSALELTVIKTDTYIISGGEVIPYHKMVERIFNAMERKPRFISCPLLFFSLAVRLTRLFSIKGVSAEMAVRMNRDQNFDYTPAANDLGYSPRPFYPELIDCIKSDRNR